MLIWLTDITLFSLTTSIHSNSLVTKNTTDSWEMFTTNSLEINRRTWATDLIRSWRREAHSWMQMKEKLSLLMTSKTFISKLWENTDRRPIWIWQPDQRMAKSRTISKLEDLSEQLNEQRTSLVCASLNKPMLIFKFFPIHLIKCIFIHINIQRILN